MQRHGRMYAKLFVLLTMVCGLTAARPADAHPMGNFSINHYARFEALPHKITLRYVLDFAEIPTVAERDAMDADGNHAVSDAESQVYLRAKADTLRDGLSLTVNGRPASLTVTPVSLVFRPGAGGLDTMRLTLDLTTPLASSIAQVHYQDNNYDARTGWKEVVADAGPGVAISNASVPATDISKELTAYPANPTLAPPQQMDASFTVGSGAAAVGHTAAGASSASTGASAAAAPVTNTHTPQDAFTQAIGLRTLTPGIIVTGLLIAFVFGAFHALSPGHGKTMVAAYLVGARGTTRHAVLLGIIVTVTHTLGVFALGLVTLFASRYVVPEKLYPILSVISGLAVFGVGIWLLASRVRGMADGHGHTHDHDHSHDHTHDHSHEHEHTHGPDEIHLHSTEHEHTHDHDHPHTHAHDHDHTATSVPHTHDHGHSHGFGHHHHHDIPEGSITLKALLALGISGGIVPCPSALVVLLSAVALHRIVYGMALISAFSVGLASVLIIIGLMVVSTRRWFDRFPAGAGLLRRLPIASAAAITLIGVVLIVRAVTQGL